MKNPETRDHVGPWQRVVDGPFVRGICQSMILNHARSIDEGTYTGGLSVVRNGEDTQISVHVVRPHDRLDEDASAHRLDFSIDEEFPKYETWIKVCKYVLDDLDNATLSRETEMYRNHISGDVGLLFSAALELRRKSHDVRSQAILPIH